MPVEWGHWSQPAWRRGESHKRQIIYICHLRLSLLMLLVNISFYPKIEANCNAAWFSFPLEATLLALNCDHENIYSLCQLWMPSITGELKVVHVTGTWELAVRFVIVSVFHLRLCKVFYALHWGITANLCFF